MMKLNESQSAPRIDFQVTQNELRKEAAQSKTREFVMSNILKSKASQDSLPAGTSIVVKMTGDTAQALHLVKEQERERMRETIIKTYHRTTLNNQENKGGPFGIK